VIVSLSAAVLLAGLVWGLWRYAGLRLWHAVIAILFGFCLASTSAAPSIDKAVRALASFLSGLHF
jgi:hypothetical protein